MQSDSISDAEYVQKLQSGQVDAFEALIRRHEKTIFNLVYRMLGDYDDAAETTQEVFFRLTGPSASFAATPIFPHGFIASRSIMRRRGARP